MEKFESFNELSKYDELMKINSEIERYNKLIRKFEDQISDLKSDSILNKKNNSLEIEKIEKEIRGIKDKITILEEKRRIVSQDLKKI